MKPQERAVKKIDFTQGSLVRSMLIFAVPFMLGVLVQTLYGTVDLLIVSYFAGTADVAAVSIGSQMMTIATYLIVGISTGVTVRIGWYFGAKNMKKLSCVTGTSIAIVAIFISALVLIYLIFHGAMVEAMQTPGEAIEPARQYIVVCSVGVIFVAGYNVLNGILTGLGNSRTPFLFILVACGINIVLDIIFVRYFHMGALGAALATTIAQAGSFIFALIYLRRKGLGYPLSFKDVRIDKEQAKSIFIISAPVAVQNVLIGVSFLFIMAIINSFGVNASAAAGVVEKLQTFLFVPAIAMSSAVSAAASQNLGAGLKRRAGQSLWCGVFIALVPSVIFTIVCQFFAREMLSIINNDPAVLDLAASYLRSFSLDVVLVCFVFCMNTFFSSCGKSWFSLLRSILTTFGVRIPVSWLMAQIPSDNLYLIGLAAPASNFVSLFMCVAFFFYLKRTYLSSVCTS